MTLSSDMTNLANRFRSHYGKQDKLGIADMSDLIAGNTAPNIILDTAISPWWVCQDINVDYGDGYAIMIPSVQAIDDSMNMYRFYCPIGQNISKDMSAVIVIRKSKDCPLDTVPMWAGGYDLDSKPSFNVTSTDWQTFVVKMTGDSSSQNFCITYDSRTAEIYPLVDIAHVTIYANTQ